MRSGGGRQANVCLRSFSRLSGMLCSHGGVDQSAGKLVCDGEVLLPLSTPEQEGMENGDEIEWIEYLIWD